MKAFPERVGIERNSGCTDDEDAGNRAQSAKMRMNPVGEARPVTETLNFGLGQ